MNPCPLILIRKLPPPPPPSLASISLFNPFPEFSTQEKADRREGKNSLGNEKIKGLLKKGGKVWICEMFNSSYTEKATIREIYFSTPLPLSFILKKSCLVVRWPQNNNWGHSKEACNKRHSPHSFLPTQFYDFFGYRRRRESKLITVYCPPIRPMAPIPRDACQRGFIHTTGS